MNECAYVQTYVCTDRDILLGHQFTTQVMTQNVNEIMQDTISGTSKWQNGKPNIC